jgi:hypothetical protein
MIKQLFSGVLLTLAITASATEVVKSEITKPAPKTKPTPIKVAMHAPVQHQPLATVVLSPEQLIIGNKVLVGKINCELAVVVTMTPDAQSPGRFFLEIGNKRHVMVPVVTSTGAVRLEEESSGAVWLQLGNKSMLMNQKEGKRMADECMSPDQLLVAQALERNPQPGLLDAPKDALVPIGAGGAVQELVPNPEPKPKLKSKQKSK